jgi:HEAT repeats
MMEDHGFLFSKRNFDRGRERSVPFLPRLGETMNRNRTWTTLAIALLTVSGCNREERGPLLAGGREVKSWIADLLDPKPQVRRQAVLKLGNVGDSDPTAADALAEVLRDSDAIVRRAAVSAVAKLSQPSAEIMAQLRVMSDRDSDPRVRDYAKRAIAHFDQAG